MLPPDEIRILLVLACLLTVPGWFFLTITGAGRVWTALQRWCLAIAVSIAFFPVLMYFLRLAPGFRMGINKWLLLLALLALVAAWNVRKSWRSLFQFDSLEWLVIAVLAVTLFTRLWAAYLNPYPAWSDSLHHTLITQIAAEQGRLPDNLQPFAPTPLDMYHLGLYAISSPVMLLARVPAHTALLWTAQTLNGLCGLGIFLVLDRKVGRVGALVGAAVVGLFSFQPAWYVNWGRFTQVSSQAILLVAWLVTWEAIYFWRTKTDQRRMLWGTTLTAALLTAGVFLLHFRVAYFYIPLLAITLLVELRQALREKLAGRFLAGVAVVGLLSIVLVSPALFSAAQVYYSKTVQPVVFSAEERQAAASLYYEFPLSSVIEIGLQPWLLVTGLFAAGYSLARRHLFSWLVLAWVLFMVLEGFAYLLKIPLLNVTNMGAVLILLYLPLGLIVGQAVQGLWHEPPFTSPGLRRVVVAGFLFAVVLASHLRVGNVEDFRYFVTTNDIAAMEWIEANTPADALFAVNTFFWMPTAPHGSDGGYWIPYFTGRKTTAGTMLFDAGSSEYTQAVIRQSLAVKNLKENYRSLDELCREGVDYLYLGAKGDFTGSGLDAERIDALPGAHRVYHQRSVTIYQVCQP